MRQIRKHREHRDHGEGGERIGFLDNETLDPLFEKLDVEIEEQADFAAGEAEAGKQVRFVNRMELVD